jgi:hypothetical protein
MRVEQSTRFVLVINVKMAKELDLIIPPAFLFHAYEAIR